MFTYRKCTDEDCAIWTELNREFMAFEIQDEELWVGADSADDKLFADTFCEALSNPEMIQLLLFEEDGIPVGFANLMIIFSVWSHGKAMIIDDLFIREANRGCGYGRKALEYIEQTAREAGCKRIQFQSEATNPAAKGFYEAIGYKPTDMYFYVKYF